MTKITNKEFSLLNVLAEIRQESGLGDKPMLSDLAKVIGKKIAAAQAMRDALSDFRFHPANNQIVKILHSNIIKMPKCEGGGSALRSASFEILSKAMNDFDEATQ